jgi:GH25 family lysozyme M1 (1,4-beta-N-acetylmuramidase)
MLKLYDISSNQGNINLNLIKADGFIIKATEGLTYINPYFKSQVKWCNLHHKIYGLYHMVRTNDNAISQARFFYNEVKEYLKPYTSLNIDWESLQGSPVEHKQTFAKQFLDELKKLSKKKAYIYMNLSTCHESGWGSVAAEYPLWLAYYSGDFNQKVNPWKKLWLQQVTDSHKISGYSLDYNLFNGSLKNWYNLTGTTYGIVRKTKHIVKKVVKQVTLKPKLSATDIKALKEECKKQGFSDFPTLHFGSKGKITKFMQKAVGAKQDEIFGKDTGNKILAFEKKYKISREKDYKAATFGKECWFNAAGNF